MSTIDLARPQSCRRTFLTAGIAALAGSATVGAAAALTTTTGDADLLAWGRQLDAGRAQQAELRPSEHAAHDEFIRLIEQWEERADGTPLASDKKAREEAYRRASKNAGFGGHPVELLENREDDLVGLVQRARAKTIAGAAVQAREAYFSSLNGDDLVGPVDDLDWDKKMMRAAALSICGLAGVDLNEALFAASRGITLRSA